MSEREPATIFTNIPVTVLAEAMRPTSKSLAPRYWENHDRVGDLDMVELKIAKAPMKQSKMKPLGNFS